MAHLEAEFVLVGREERVETAIQPLKEEGYHVELVSAQPMIMQTLSVALNRAHFSQILV